MNPKNIEANNSLPNINGRLNLLAENTPSIQTQRVIDLCKDATTEQTVGVCENLNRDFSYLLSEKWINFSKALEELVNPNLS